MTKYFRIPVATVVVAAIVVGLVTLNRLARKDQASASQAPRNDLKPDAPKAPRTLQALGTPQAAAPVSTTSDGEKAPDLAENASHDSREKFIEEELSEAGEDPDAVYYMSRVREAVAEANPTFARELLRQMKELHAGSVLVGEAEGLLEDPKKTRGR